jgi:bifunctional non-homologous end joining protein LigD
MDAVKPMLANPGTEPFDSPDHIFEWKWNGIRIVARKRDKEVTLQGRSGADFTAKFPELKAIVKLIRARDADIDGEVVCLGASGLPEFNRIQQRSGKVQPMEIQAAMEAFPATFEAFDLTQVDEYDLTARGAAAATLMQRKDILQKVLEPNGIVKLSPWVDGKGIELHKKAVELNQEGVMAKRKTSLYQPGGRTDDWLKLKVPKFANLVVCGYTKGTGWRLDTFGALVLADRHDGKLIYVGCAGSGFQAQQVKDMFAVLQTIKTEVNPFGHPQTVPGLVSWVQPVLVANVKYFDITKTGQLIWPIWQYMATNMKPEDINNAG